MWESWCGDQAIPEELLWRDIPADHAGDLEVVLDLLDWDRNVTPDFTAEREMTPIPTLAARSDPDASAREHWTTYRASAFSSSELAVGPRSSTSCVDQAAYGCLVIQGQGMVGGFRVEAPTMLRFGQPSGDELFVSEGRAREGVTITNLSDHEPLVILKHFGPDNPDLALALADG